MALETDRSTASGRLLEHLGSGAKRLADAASGVQSAGALPGPVARILNWIGQTAPSRFLSKSLLRRILAANLFGLIVMVGGIHYLSQYHAWLIEAKRESLKVQGEMIAAAIASDARVEKGTLQFNPEKLGAGSASMAPYRDDGFAKLELSIKPERVAPILRRLSQPTKTRARIYDRDGTLVVDSATLLTRGQLSRAEPVVPSTERLKTKNFWTRLKAWLIDQDLPVYKEIGSANGLSYPEVRMAMTGSPTPMLLLNDAGEQIVSMAVPIKKLAVVQGVLLLSTRPGEIDAVLDEERSLIWTLAAIALGATILTSLLLARTVAGPMRRLSEAADHVSRSISARQELPEFEGRDDEVGQMASAFRSMTASLYRRIAASERFAADVAHELKNPLTAARSTAESLSYAKTEEQRAQLVSQIQLELKRLNRLITDVSNASRLDAELARKQMRPVDTRAVVATVATIFRDDATTGGRHMNTVVEPSRGDGAYTIEGDEGRLGQVLTNLVDNALSFSPAGGTVTLHAVSQSGFVEIYVDDEGSGIPEDRLDRIFERFYTDRPGTENLRGKNSGLGLSISREIVVAHHGQIWAENLKSDGRVTGARFVVRLPIQTSVTRGIGASSGRRN
jgi:two-component system, OmpR family, sensor histidine kinase ChvG